MTKYKLIRNTPFYKKGTVVQRFYGPDYGVARQDELVTGVPHITVQEDDASPFFSVAEQDLEQQD